MDTPLVLDPVHFNEFAVQMAGDLTNRGLIHTHEQFDQTVALVERRLRFQHHLHLTWQDGDEDTHARTRMDQP